MAELRFRIPQIMGRTYGSATIRAKAMPSFIIADKVGTFLLGMRLHERFLLQLFPIGVVPMCSTQFLNLDTA